MPKSKYFGTAKNNKANMPQGVVEKTYAKRNYAIMEGGYVDTQPEIDSACNKAVGKIRSGRRK